MLKTLYLFTNRNLMAFDETDGQDITIQKGIGWDTVDRIYSEREHLERIIEDKPEIFLSQWNKGQPIIIKISIEELCCLLGHGKWYWTTYLDKSFTKGE